MFMWTAEAPLMPAPDSAIACSCGDAAAFIERAGYPEIRARHPRLEGTLMTYIVHELEISGGGAIRLLHGLNRDHGPTTYVLPVATATRSWPTSITSRACLQVDLEARAPVVVSDGVQPIAWKVEFRPCALSGRAMRVAASSSIQRARVAGGAGHVSIAAT
jgi:hypothetical protein